MKICNLRKHEEKRIDNKIDRIIEGDKIYLISQKENGYSICNLDGKLIYKDELQENKTVQLIIEDRYVFLKDEENEYELIDIINKRSTAFGVNSAMIIQDKYLI